MKINKINNTTEPTQNTENKDVSFKAIKLKRSSFKMTKPLEKDIFELRKTLPDNKLAKEKKYFGNPNIGPFSGGEGKDPSDMDAIIMGGLVAAGIALAML